MIAQTSPLAQLLSLSESDRLAARDVARENVIKRIGPKPTREQYQDRTAGEYPRYVVIVVTTIVMVLLAAFFVISAQRLYSIGKEKFTTPRDGNAITFEHGGMVAGIAIVIGSESAALGFWLAAGVLGKRRSEKRVLYALSLASTALALIGNGQFALGGDWSNLTGDPFSIIEALLPPLVVLGAGLTFERLFVDDIARRHANEREFQQDLAAWTAATGDPESSQHWKQAYANALKHKLVEANGRGRGQAERRELMGTLTAADWRALVYRELQADSWYDTAQPDQPVALPVAVVAASPAPRDPQRDQELAVHPLELVSPSGNGHNGTH
jgi:hypothetical protein